MDLQPSYKNDVTVSVAPHPFAVEHIHSHVPEGLNIADIMIAVQSDALLRRHAHVYINGDYVPQDSWARVRPKASAIVTIRMVPMGGGGGKNPLRTVLSLAVMVASPYLAAGINGALGIHAGASFLGFSAARIVTSGVNLLGRLAMNALAPPGRTKFSSAKESPTLFIQGARNQAYPFGRVPRVLGKHRMVPPLGGLPYTETVGDQQYLRMLFIWGYGPLQISDLKIGETPLEDFEEVEIENRQGYDSDEALTLYTNTVIQNDLQIVLTNAAGYVTRTTDTDAEEISVDVTFPRGLVEFSGTKKKTVTVQIEVQYSVKDANDWTAPATGYKAISAQNLTGLTRPSYRTVSNINHVARRIYAVVMDPASGELRRIAGPDFIEGLDTGSAVPPLVPENEILLAHVERRSDDATTVPSGRITDKRESSLFGAEIEDSLDFAVTTSVSNDAVDIAAGGLQFAGFDISGKQTSALRQNVKFKVPKGQYDVRLKRLTADSEDDDVFDEVHWTALRTIRYESPVVMTGLAMTALRIKATDQLNGVLDRFNGVVHSILPDWDGSGWVDQVTDNPASIFRHVLQGNGNARPLADSRVNLTTLQSWHETCTDESRSFNAVIDYDVSVHELLKDVAATGRASPALIDGKWSIVEDTAQSVPVQHFTPRNTFGFKGEKAFDDLPHGLRVRFINRDKGWLQDERLVFDDGYTEETATKYETLEFSGITSADQAWRDGRYHIASARLRPETYTFFADVEHIVCTRGDLIRFTHDVPLVGLGSARVKAIATSAGNTTGVTLDADVTMEAGKTYAARFRKSDGTSVLTILTTAEGASAVLTFATPVATASGPAAGDLALFGESGLESIELVVKSIEPQGNLTARITCVDAAPAVHTADTGSIPSHSAQITVPPEMQRPPVPVVIGTQSGDEVVIRHPDGSFEPTIVISLAPSGFDLPLTVDVRIKAEGETNFAPATFTHSNGKIEIRDVIAGVQYDVKIYYKNTIGIASPAATIAAHEVKGVTVLPSDVTGMGIGMVGSAARLHWTPSEDFNLSHYLLKFSNETNNAVWSSAFETGDQVAKTATSLNVPAQIGTWMMKAVDTEGRESVNAASAVATIDRIDGYTQVALVNETTTFSGSMTAGSTDVIFTPADYLELDGTLTGTYLFGETADLGTVYVSRLSANITVNGFNVQNLVDNWTDFDAIEDIDGLENASKWNVTLQVRTTEDDPAGSPTWGSWQDFTIGEYKARAFEFRLLMESYEADITPSVSALSVKIDMLNMTQEAEDITSSASDSPATSVTFTDEFQGFLAVAIATHDMATGDYFVITNKTKSGFDIKFFDSTDSRVTRTFDYIARGIGRKVAS